MQTPPPQHSDHGQHRRWIKVPTVLALHLPALCQAAAQVCVHYDLDALECPTDVLPQRIDVATCRDKRGDVECVKVTRRGGGALFIHIKAIRQLQRMLGPQAIAHAWRSLPMRMLACIAASWRDEQSERAPDAAFAAQRVRSGTGREVTGENKFRRMTTLAHEAITPQALSRCRTQMQLLEWIGIDFELSGAHHRCIPLIGPAAPTSTIDVRGSLDQGAHHGGQWRLFKLHDTLDQLRRSHYVWIEERALALSPRDVSTLLAVKAQAALRRHYTPTISEARLIREGGHAQPTTRGDARAKRLLKGSIDRLAARGFVHTHELVDDSNAPRAWRVGVWDHPGLDEPCPGATPTHPAPERAPEHAPRPSPPRPDHEHAQALNYLVITWIHMMTQVDSTRQRASQRAQKAHTPPYTSRATGRPEPRAGPSP